MLNYIKSNEELQRKLNWRKCKKNLTNQINLEEGSSQEINDFPPAFNLKLEESNLGNIYNHIDLGYLNRRFFTCSVSKVIKYANNLK